MTVLFKLVGVFGRAKRNQPAQPAAISAVRGLPGLNRCTCSLNPSLRKNRVLHGESLQNLFGVYTTEQVLLNWRPCHLVIWYPVLLNTVHP